MTVIDTLLFGAVASLVTLKVVLLAAAAVLLVHVVTARARLRKIAPTPVPVRQATLDRYA